MDLWFVAEIPKLTYLVWCPFSEKETIVQPLSRNLPSLSGTESSPLKLHLRLLTPSLTSIILVTPRVNRITGVLAGKGVLHTTLCV